MAVTVETIQIRGGTGGQWQVANTVLLDREIGIETDATPIAIKIGDGSTPWVTLPYFGGSGGGVTNGDKGDITVTGAGTVNESWLLDSTVLSAAARLAIVQGTNSLILGQLGALDLTLGGTLTAGTLTAFRDAVAAKEFTTLQQVQALVSGVSAPVSVAVRTTANITIATALVTGQTLNGYTLLVNDVVLVANQTAASQNGLYTVSATPTRTAGYTVWTAFLGLLVYPINGSTGSLQLYLSTAASGGTLGTTALNFVQYSPAGILVASNNLSDVASTSTALANLGGVAATGGAAGTLTSTTTTLAGVTTVGGAIVLTPNSPGSTVIDVTKPNNKFSINANTTYTFSAAPATGTLVAAEFTNSGGSTITVQLPTAFDDARQMTITNPTINIVAGGKVTINWERNASSWTEYGAGPVTQRNVLIYQSGSFATPATSAVTGVTALTAFAFASAPTIPANTLIAARSCLRITGAVRKTTATASTTIQMFLGPLGTTSDPKIYGDPALGATPANNNTKIDTEIYITTSTSMTCMSGVIQNQAPNGVMVDRAIDLTVANILTVAVTPTNAADSHVAIFVQAEHILV